MVKAPYEEQVKVVRRALDAGINVFRHSVRLRLGKVGGELGADSQRSRRRPGDLDEDSPRSRLRRAISKRRRSVPSRPGSNGSAASASISSSCIPGSPGRAAWSKRFSLTPNDVLGPDGVIEGFKTMRERGKVGFFGFSGLGETTALHELVDSGEFHGFQCYYNLLNPSAGQPVPEEFQRAGLRFDPRSRRGKRNGRLHHSRSGGRRADCRSQHRRRRQWPDAFAGFRLSARSATRRKSENRPWRRWKRSDSSRHPFRLDESRRLPRCSSASPIRLMSMKRWHARARRRLSEEQMAKMRKLWETDFNGLVEC